MSKKLFLLILSSAFLIINSNAQEWSPPGTDFAFTANCFTEYKGELYAGSKYWTDYPCIFKLTDSKWEIVGKGILPAFAEVKCMAVYKDELYVGGVFETAGGKRAISIARWDGNEWHDVGGGIDGWDKKVNTMAVYDDELYIGGSFKSAGGKLANCIAKWNGKTWSAVGTGLTGPPKAFIVYKGELYAGGDLISTTGKSAAVCTRLNNIGRWNGKEWLPVGPLGKATLDAKYAFAIYKDELYVTGYHGEINGKTGHRLTKWDGTKWSVIKGMEGLIYAIAVYNDELYVGGQMGLAGTKKIKDIAKWNGTEWFALKGGVSDDVYTLFPYKDELWVTGFFREVDEKNIKYMAKYKEEIKDEE